MAQPTSTMDDHFRAVLHFLRANIDASGNDPDRVAPLAQSAKASLFECLGRVRSLNFNDAADCIALLSDSSFTAPQRAEITDAVNVKATHVGATAPGGRRAKAQVFFTLQHFMTNRDWVQLGDAAMPTNQKLHVIARRFERLGCVFPTEPTLIHAVGMLLLHNNSGDINNNILQQVRARVRLAHYGQVARFPDNPHMLHQIYPHIFESVYESDPPAPNQVNEMLLHQLRNQLPCRKTHTAIASHGRMLAITDGRTNHPQQQNALAQLAIGLMAGGGGGEIPCLPGFRLTPLGQDIASGRRQQPPTTPATVAAPAAVGDAAAVALAVAPAAGPAAGAPLALADEDGIEVVAAGLEDAVTPSPEPKAGKGSGGKVKMSIDEMADSFAKKLKKDIAQPEKLVPAAGSVCKRPAAAPVMKKAKPAAVSSDTVMTKAKVGTSKKVWPLKYPGVPKAEKDAVTVGDFRLMTDMKRQQWRIRKIGTRPDKAFSWKVDGAASWKRMAEYWQN
ncbi:unnamed protein product, partial [Prorocentrum cordatum]